MSTIEALHESLAEALGEDRENIRATNPRWLDLMKEGVIINLHIGRWRAKTRLTWKDLGINLDETANAELSKIIDLGHKKLLPAKLLKELDSIESGSRKLLEKKSYKTYWGCFVPVTAYQEWKEQIDEYIAKYFGARDRIVTNYDTIVNEVLVGYEIAARGSYERLKALHPESLKQFPNEEAFVRAFVEGIRAHLVSADEIRDSFHFSIELRYVPLPSLMAEEQAEEERIRQEAQAGWDRVWAEREIQEAEVRTARATAETKEQMLREMNRDIIEQTRRQKEALVDDFLRDVVIQLRNLVYQATTDVLAAMQKKDTLHPRSVVQLKNLVSQVKSLNFYGDDDIDRMIEKVAGQVDKMAEDRDLDEIQDNLRDIAIVTRASLIGLGETPRRARSLGVVDQPTGEMVRKARRGLGLDSEAIDVPAFEVRRPRLMEVEV